MPKTLTLFSFLLSLLIAPEISAAPPDSFPGLGTNVTLLRENSGEYPFVDAFKTSLPWRSGELHGCFDCGPPLDLDARGWVRTLDDSQPNGGQVAITLLFNELQDHYPGGTYTVRYSGAGTLAYEGSATLSAASCGAGCDLVEVDPSSPEPFVLTLTSTDPLGTGDYLQDIRVLMPGGVCTGDGRRLCADDTGCAPSAGTCELFASSATPPIFYPPFLADLEPFSLLRVMDWMETNVRGFTDFAEYPTLDDARWPSAPPEILAALANAAGTDLWINFSHSVSDSFVTTFAQRMLAGLDPAHQLWVELSGEVWNPNFAQHLEAARMGCARWMDLQGACDQDDVPMNGVYCEGHPERQVPGCVTAQRRFYAQRSVEVWDLVMAAFGTVPGGTDRVVRVLGSQTENLQLHADYLAWGDTALRADVLATAGYFGYVLGTDPAVSGWTLDQLFEAIESQELPEILDFLSVDAGFLAANHPGISLVQYEGGQHLTGVGALETEPQMAALFAAANQDPRMGQVYRRLLEGWRSRVGTMFVHFLNAQTWRDYGRWGALEFTGQPHGDSVRYQELLRFSEGLANEIFVDGFESGNVMGWSSSLP